MRTKLFLSGSVGLVMLAAGCVPAPKVDFVPPGPVVVLAGQSVKIHALVSGGVEPLEYEWQWGGPNDWGIHNGANFTVTPPLVVAGTNTYTAHLTVRDGLGREANGEIDIQIRGSGGSNGGGSDGGNGQISVIFDLSKAILTGCVYKNGGIEVGQNVPFGLDFSHCFIGLTQAPQCRITRNDGWVIEDSHFENWVIGVIGQSGFKVACLINGQWKEFNFACVCVAGTPTASPDPAPGGNPAGIWGDLKVQDEYGGPLGTGPLWTQPLMSGGLAHPTIEYNSSQGAFRLFASGNVPGWSGELPLYTGRVTLDLPVGDWTPVLTVQDSNRYTVSVKTVVIHVQPRSGTGGCTGTNCGSGMGTLTVKITSPANNSTLPVSTTSASGTSFTATITGGQPPFRAQWGMYNGDNLFFDVPDRSYTQKLALPDTTSPDPTKYAEMFLRITSSDGQVATDRINIRVR